MSDGHSHFSLSISFLYGDSFGGYIKRLFFPIGKYFKENPQFVLVTSFFLFANTLICPSDIFPSTNVMLLGQVSTLKHCFLLSQSTQLLKKSLEKICYSNSNHRFYKSKRKAYVNSACSILSLMKSGAPFFSIDIMYTIYLDVKYFSVVCLSILETCCKNYAYNDGTFLRKKVKLLSVRHNL